MDDSPEKVGRALNLWAPWRMEYVSGIDDSQAAECFLCRDRDHPDEDQKNLLIWRGPRCMAVLNRFPYTGGHSLVAPYDHVPGLGDLPTATIVEMMEMIRDLQALLRHTVHAHGFNIGMNVGRCAGAGLPGHIHMHIVPRWDGDTNFLPALGGTRVIPNLLDDLLAELMQAGRELNLPNLTP